MEKVGALNMTESKQDTANQFLSKTINGEFLNNFLKRFKIVVELNWRNVDYIIHIHRYLFVRSFMFPSSCNQNWIIHSWRSIVHFRDVSAWKKNETNKIIWKRINYALIGDFHLTYNLLDHRKGRDTVNLVKLSICFEKNWRHQNALLRYTDLCIEI